MKFTCCILIFAAILIATSCTDVIDSDSSMIKYKLENTLNSGRIFPLDIGYNWSYSELETDASGNKTKDDTVKVEILRDSVMNGERWYTIDIWGVFWFTNKNDGAHCFISNDTMSSLGDMLLYKYPANVGDTYKNDANYFTVISTDTTIVVPAGTYKCYCYRKYIENSLNDLIYTENEFCAPGVGRVKYAIEHIRQSTGKTTYSLTYELISNKFIDNR